MAKFLKKLIIIAAGIFLLIAGFISYIVFTWLSEKELGRNIFVPNEWREITSFKPLKTKKWRQYVVIKIGLDDVAGVAGDAGGRVVGPQRGRENRGRHGGEIEDDEAPDLEPADVTAPEPVVLVRGIPEQTALIDAASGVDRVQGDRDGQSGRRHPQQ